MPVSPPPPRRRKKVGFADSEESAQQQPQRAADRGLASTDDSAVAAAWGRVTMGEAASQRPGRSTASGNSSSYEIVEGPLSPETPSPEPDRWPLHAERVQGDVGREGDGHDRSWSWEWTRDASDSGRQQTSSWSDDRWVGRWSSWGPWDTWDWDTWSWDTSSSWRSWRGSSRTPWTATVAAAGEVVQTPALDGDTVPPSAGPPPQHAGTDDPVAAWWQADDKLAESFDAANCPDGAWEHYRMNANSEEEAVHEEEGQDAHAKVPDKARPRIPSSYPASFAALPTESYREWKRAVEMWIAGEGGLLPCSVIGPRVLSVLKGRASILTRKLSVERVSQPEGLSLIFHTLESSSLVQELSGQRGERAQREFLQCRRAPHESLDSFLMRVEAQRDLMLEEDPEFAMGERFLVGYVLDNSELTQRDRVLVMAAAGNKLSTSAVYPALRRMGPFLQGTVPIGRGLSDRPLLPELQPDAPQGTGSNSQPHVGRGGRFGRSYGTHLLAEEEAEDGMDDSPETLEDTGEDEITGVEHEALVAVQQGQARLRAIRQARGYYRRNEQSTGGDSAAKKRLEELMAKNPCRNCGGFGHWSRDAVCPKNQAKAAASTNVAATLAPSDSSTKVSAAMTASSQAASMVAPSHAALTAVLESFVDRQQKSASHVASAYMTAAAVLGEGPAAEVIDLNVETYIAQPTKTLDYEGSMILDIGCVRSVAGTAWIEREIALRQKLGKHVFVERTSDWFRFGDGVRRLSSYRVHLEIAIKGHVGLLAVNVIDYPCPPLMSKAVCNALGMCIDCEANSCEIRRLGERRCPLAVSTEGHYLVRINDFFPRNPSWHALVFDQHKRPKVDCEEVRMFEIRQGCAVGKGSKSRLRRQSQAALRDICTDARLAHGSFDAQSPAPNQGGSSGVPQRTSCHSLGTGLARVRSELSDAGGRGGGDCGRMGGPGGGCVAGGRSSRCIHDLDPPQEAGQASSGQGQGTAAFRRSSSAGQDQHQVNVQSRAASGNNRSPGRLSVVGNDQIGRPADECIVGVPPEDHYSQVEGDAADDACEGSLPADPRAMEEKPSMAWAAVRDRTSRHVGPLRFVCEDAAAAEGSRDVPLEHPSCASEVPLQAFQRGQTQRLKKGVSHALHGQALLRQVARAVTDRKFCVLEVFGTSVSYHAAEHSDWIALEPVDLLCGVDLSDKLEQDRVLKQIDELSPDLVLLMPPCGPWSCMQSINDPAVVVWKRLMAFHLWEFTRKVWDLQTSKGGLCLTEQPWLSKALELQVMASRPHLHRALIDQCAFELRDPGNNRPMRKRTVLDVNSARFAALLEQGGKCTHAREDHQVIEGATCVKGQWVNRTLFAGMWTKQLCLHILQAATQTLLNASGEPPGERSCLMVDSHDPQFVNLSKDTCFHCQAEGTFTCCAYCLKPSCPTCVVSSQCSLQWDGHEPFDNPCDSHLSCVTEVQPSPDQIVGDPEDLAEMEIRKEFKRLQEEEDQRKGDFGGIGSRYGYVRFVGPAIRLPKEVRNQLAKLHGHFGHPSNERLAHMLQINGASKGIIEGAKALRCSICERISGPRSAPQASSKAPSRFNEQCVLDSFFILDCTGQRWNVTHMLDGFCTLQYAVCSKNPSSNVSAELLFDRLIMCHGPPADLCVDGGSEFRGAFETMCRVFDIRLTVLPTSAKFKAGLSERHGAILKLMVLRVIHELSLTKEHELRLAVSMCCQAKNRLLRKCGHSPLQVVQGRDIVVPSALVQQVADGEVRMTTNHSISHDEEVNRMEQMRCAAISAFQWLDSHERLRVALNARSRPPKLVALVPGTVVYFHKPPGQHRRLQDSATGQQGPGVVAATEGVDKVWIRFKGSVVRVALENVRLATPEETLDTRYICDVLTDMQQELTGARRPSGYEELTEPSNSPVQVDEAIVTDVPVGTSPPANDPTRDIISPEPETAKTSTGTAEDVSVTRDETHAADHPPATSPTVPSLVLPEAECTPEMLKQLEMSRQAADRLDGYRPKPKSSPEVSKEVSEPASASSEPLSNSRTIDIPTSLEGAGAKHKIEYFDGGAQAEVWEAIQERLGSTFDLSESALKRARLDADLRMAAELIPQSFTVLKGERKRDPDGQQQSEVKSKLSRRDFSGNPPFRVSKVSDPFSSAFEVCEAGVVPWAPQWAQTCWALEVAICNTSSGNQEDRLKLDKQLREDRFLLLEQGLDEELKNKELATCVLERGHGNGPPPGARNEIFVRDMTAAEVRLTVPALVKALTIHFDHEAVRPVPLGQIVPKERVIRSRMVIVNKKQLTAGFEPKGRLCVGGHRDPDLGKYDAASPTALSLAHALLLCIATTLQWSINIADVTAAFLQGLALPRSDPLYVQAPSGCPPEVLEYLRWRLGPDNKSDMFEATKGIFGLSESPRLWYLRFKETLEELSFFESKLVPCLFMKHNAQGDLIGLIALHVDDALLAGSSEVEADWTTLQSRLKFGSWTDLTEGGKFLGRVMKQSQDRSTVTVDMNLYCQNMSEIDLESTMNDETPVTPLQATQLRALVGQLGWLAKQGRPDIAFSVSYLQQNLVDATGSTLKLANSTVQRAKQETSYVIKGLECSLADIMVLVATDGALAAMPRGKSQLGIFLMLANPKVQTEVSAVAPIEWCSTSCKRVVRSSSAVEAAAASLGYEHAEFLRAMLCEIRDAGFVMRRWFEHVTKCPILLILDAKVAYDCLSSDELPQDRRTALDIRALRESLSDPSSSSFCRWIPGQQQASDSLTKLKGNNVLQAIMCSGRWDDAWQEVRAQQRTTQRAYKKRLKATRGSVGESKDTC